MRFQAAAAVGYLVLACATVVGWLFSRDALVLLWGASALLLFTAQVVTYGKVRRVQSDLRAGYRQIESMFSMFSVLELKSPLPPMNGYAICPDFGNLLIKAIHERRPRLVIEAGSGTSTILIAYCLKKLGVGTLVALEHQSDFAEASRRELESHGLQDVAQVRHAPLKEISIHGQAWKWYDSEQLRDIGRIDMVVIDGPPAHVGHLARYPALPLLFPLLGDGAVILLDDWNRRDEREIAKLWREEYPCLRVEEYETDKGALVIRLDKARNH